MEKQIKLTHYSSGAGWACKIGAKDLTQVLSKLNSFNNSNTSGFEHFDDCAIYRLNKTQSIIQTVDFFTPIVDDPYTFGQIAAANALSDIYAMGGMPIFALNIVAFPTDKLDLDILSIILKGGEDKCTEANVKILGGHSIKDDVPKYGLAVTGIIDNEKIIKNNNAKLNDDLILTKPLGTGIITTAIKKDIAKKATIKMAIDVMTSLNNIAAEKINSIKVNACTDITGYGLVGHLHEICKSSNLSAKINYKKIPFIDQVESLAINDIIPGGSKNNLAFFNENISFYKEIRNHQKLMLSDAQTSGGLLISVSKNNSKKLLKELNKNSEFKSSLIGELVSKKEKTIFVINE